MQPFREEDGGDGQWGVGGGEFVLSELEFT